jgi:uncharacterized protein YceK
MLILAALLTATGCASINNLKAQRKPYGGTKYDLDIVTGSASRRHTAPVVGLYYTALWLPCLVDTPFSFVLDTLTRPLTEYTDEEKAMIERARRAKQQQREAEKIAKRQRKEKS